MKKKGGVNCMNILEQFVSSTNTILWSYILIAMLIGLGLYFSIKLKFVQITSFGEMIRLIGDGRFKQGKPTSKK